jgi:hypothetical protein
MRIAWLLYVHRCCQLNAGRCVLSEHILSSQENKTFCTSTRFQPCGAIPKAEAKMEFNSFLASALAGFEPALPKDNRFPIYNHLTWLSYPMTIHEEYGTT